MVYIISTPKGEKIIISYDESKPITKIRTVLKEEEDGSEIAKTVTFKKEG